jgi:hypothetical protein
VHAAAGDRPAAGGERPTGGGGGSAAGGERPSGGGGRGGPAGSRVYVPRGGKVAVVRFRAGISDDEFTEMLGGPLKEGDEVVIDVAGGPQRPGSAPSSSSRGRGPRFF